MTTNNSTTANNSTTTSNVEMPHNYKNRTMPQLAATAFQKLDRVKDLAVEVRRKTNVVVIKFDRSLKGDLDTRIENTLNIIERKLRKFEANGFEVTVTHTNTSKTLTGRIRIARPSKKAPKAN